MSKVKMPCQNFLGQNHVGQNLVGRNVKNQNIVGHITASQNVACQDSTYNPSQSCITKTERFVLNYNGKF